MKNKPKTLDFKVSPVFLANYDAYHNPDVKVIANQGGTRSGKTFSITQLLILIGMTENKVISVVSKTLPHIKRGVLRDFINILDNPEYGLGTFDENSYNRTELVYKFSNNSFVEFFSADNSDKLRGPGRDVLFINEVNLLSLEEWQQLIYRTRYKIFCDYNPVDEYCWLYDHVLTRNDCKFIQSSYIDNYDFLPATQIKEIERIKDIDAMKWEIYGLGNIAKATNIIFDKFTITPHKETPDVVYGLDFGFNNPTALVEVCNYDNDLYVKEMLYESHLTNSQLIDKLNLIITNKNAYIYADAAEPQRIEEIRKAGFNIWSASKEVKIGIDFVKNFKLNIDEKSPSLIKEIKSYKYKETRDGIVLEEPVKLNDHLMDAMRYAIYTHGNKYWRRQTATFVLPTNRIKRNQKTKFTGYL